MSGYKLVDVQELKKVVVPQASLIVVCRHSASVEVDAVVSCLLGEVTILRAEGIESKMMTDI
uniref:Uncharacterized protein n=1 Tax=Setaria italica TaxID=4555 RepID=K3Z2P6_SETIT